MITAVHVIGQYYLCHLIVKSKLIYLFFYNLLNITTYVLSLLTNKSM